MDLQSQSQSQSGMRMKEKVEDHRGASWPRPKKEEVAEQGMTDKEEKNQ